MNKFLALYLLLVGTSHCKGAQILALFHFPSYSHNAVPNAIVEELARKGHEITVITSDPRKTPIKNIEEINLDGYKAALLDNGFDLFQLENISSLISELFLNSMIINATEALLKHENVQQLLNSNRKFDLVLIEDFLGHSIKGFCHHFNVPCIMISSAGSSSFNNAQVGNPYFPSYIPGGSSSYSSRMNFFERMHNMIHYVLTEIFQHLYVIPRHNELLQKYFPNPPQMQDIYYNVSLVLVNAHVSVQQAVPYVPNMVDVGGIHVKPPKPLPKDIQEFLDGAKDGAIFFSMGSNLKSAQLKPNKRDAILNTFSKLKQRVIWKFEDKNLPGKPSNVKIGEWLPQSDILAHPNVKLFITHGGLMSQIETVVRGVPILGIPIYGDQKMNMANAELKEIGLTLRFSEISEETFTKKIQEIFTNPKYLNNAKKYARIMQDQPVKPLEKAVFWIEYVLRHKGAPHLRVAALDLTWYQYLLLDVIAFLIVTTVVLVKLFCIIIKKLGCCRQKSKKVAKTKKE